MVAKMPGSPKKTLKAFYEMAQEVRSEVGRAQAGNEREDRRRPRRYYKAETHIDKFEYESTLRWFDKHESRLH